MKKQTIYDFLGVLRSFIYKFISPTLFFYAAGTILTILKQEVLTIFLKTNTDVKELNQVFDAGLALVGSVVILWCIIELVFVLLKAIIGPKEDLFERIIGAVNGVLSKYGTWYLVAAWSVGMPLADFLGFTRTFWFWSIILFFALRVGQFFVRPTGQEEKNVL